MVALSLDWSQTFCAGLDSAIVSVSSFGDICGTVSRWTL
jgi:hypothetical protein